MQGTTKSFRPRLLRLAPSHRSTAHQSDNTTEINPSAGEHPPFDGKSIYISDLQMKAEFRLSAGMTTALHSIRLRPLY